MVSITEIQEFISSAKIMRRLLDNYSVPLDVKTQRTKDFLNSTIKFLNTEHISLKNEKKDEFALLVDDVLTQAASFIQYSGKTALDDAIRLLDLIISVEDYLLAVEKVPWKIGRKVSWLEKKRIQSIFRKELKDLYNPQTRRAVRGTRVRVILSGSLAYGVSDYKFIYNTDTGALPKPSDYKLPRKYWSIIDSELNVAIELKEKMSDVDILIINEVIYDSMNPSTLQTVYSYKVGEKYRVPLGPMLSRIHQSLESTKIGGIRGRWVNYVILRDEVGYDRYLRSREGLIHRIEQTTGNVIVIHDVVILDEIVGTAA